MSSMLNSFVLVLNLVIVAFEIGLKYELHPAVCKSFYSSFESKYTSILGALSVSISTIGFYVKTSSTLTSLSFFGLATYLTG